MDDEVVMMVSHSSVCIHGEWFDLFDLDWRHPPQIFELASPTDWSVASSQVDQSN